MALQTCLEKEQFSTLNRKYSFDFPDKSPNVDTRMDSIQSLSMSGMYQWEMEKEQELNGDLALIPELSDNSHGSMNKIIDSPPTLDIHRIMNELQDFICVDSINLFPIDENIAPLFEENNDSLIQENNDILIQGNNDIFNQEKLPSAEDDFNTSTNGTFDLSKYLMEDESKSKCKHELINAPSRQPRLGMKKIDLKARKYIVDNDDDDDSMVEEESLDKNKHTEEEMSNDTIDVEGVPPDDNMDLQEKTSNDNNTAEVSSENQNTPFIEACDLYSLLEQFEATEMPDFPPSFMDDNTHLNAIPEPFDIKDNKMDIFSQSSYVEQDSTSKSNDVETTENIKNVIKDKTPESSICIKKEIKLEPVAVEKSVNAQIIQKKETPHHPITVKLETPHHPRTVKVETPVQTAPETTKPKPLLIKKCHSQIIVPSNTKRVLHVPQDSTTSIVQESAQIPNRKVLNELPQALISRIKGSKKRKIISVIPPIPNKKRCVPKTQETAIQLVPNKPVKIEAVNVVRLDHDYCRNPCQEPIKKEPSVKPVEEDERVIMMKQPMVKNADGKLMVSLLKVNTIHANNGCQKKKLDIEEYKKRREGKIKIQRLQNVSASSSSCSSPAQEDENTRILKHQEKLRKMAKEVLKTRPKSEKKPESISPVQLPSKQLKIPSDIEMKTVVSIGVNTDFKICKNLDPVTPVQQLEEIKPLLQKASNKFNSNSLITSVIENIPKVINNSKDVNVKNANSTIEHGEDKIISYLEKNRVLQKTDSVEIQTNISLIQHMKEGRYRRRTESSSSSSSSASRNSGISSHYSRRRKTSVGSSESARSSRSSKSSYTSRSHSRSRSRSRTPTRRAQWEQERIREVEERRVVYVGNISDSTSRDHLRDRFARFGPITNISLHFRDHGYFDNYGFVTFANQCDAFEALEHGNDDPHDPEYELSFGGRRQFCKTTYSDLDNMRDETTYYSVPVVESSFDMLLKEAKEDAELRRRKF